MLKSPDAFRTISEVAEDLDLPQHVLRFWETRFPQIRPLKRAGGRRYYRPADVLLLRCVRQLLYDEGYTIKGVQRLLKEQGTKSLRAGEQPAPTEPIVAADLGGIEPESEGRAAADDPAPPAAAGADLATRPAGWPAEDRAALHEALALVEDCAEILRAARHGQS